jgi:GAF domain-containing protein
MTRADLWLTTTMVELAEAADARPSETHYATMLVMRLSERLAPAQCGLLVSGHSGELTLAAASGEAASRLAEVQVELRQGPCLECYLTARPVHVENLAAADQIWPGFVAAARETGFNMIAVVPLRRRERPFGAIFAIATRPGLLAQDDLSELNILARMASMAMAQQRELRRSLLAAEQLQRALDSRVVIEQAKGALAARLNIPPDQAFDLLRGHARRHNLTLAEVAGKAIRNELSPLDLMAWQAPDRTPTGGRRNPQS